MYSSGYQSMLGTDDIQTDVIDTDTLTVHKELNVLGNAEIDSLILPTGATVNNVLTCISALGNTAWRPIATPVLAGDATGPLSSNRVDNLGGGTIPVNTLVTLNGTQTLYNKTLGTFDVRGISQQIKIFPNTTNLETSINFNTRTLGGGTSWTLGQGSYSAGVGNIGFGVSSGAGLCMKIETTGSMTLPYPLKVSSFINTGTLTLPTITDTLVGQTTPDTMTNKTIKGTTNSIDANTLRNGSLWTVDMSGSAPTSSQVLTYNGTNGVWQTPTVGPDVVTLTGTQTLTNKTMGNTIFSNNINMGGSLLDLSGKFMLTSSNFSLYLGKAGNANMGQYNLGIGESALANGGNGGAQGNVAVGVGNLQNNTGVSNTAVGVNAGLYNTSGEFNSSYGYQSGSTNTTGTTNVCIGAYADVASSGLSNATAIGTAAIVSDSNTVQLGNANVTTVNTKQSYSIDGKRILTTKASSATLGNLRIGDAAGVDTMSGTDNLLIGPSCGRVITTGSQNTGSGSISLYNISSAFFNTACGYRSLFDLTTGNSNVAVGYNAGSILTTGSNNTFVGLSASTTVNNVSNSTAIGNSATVSASNTVQLGNTAVTTCNTFGQLTVQKDGAQQIFVYPNTNGTESSIGFSTNKLGGGGTQWTVGQGTNGIGVGIFGVGCTGLNNVLSIFSSSGVVKLAYGLSLPSAGGGFGSILNHYEEFLHNTQFTGPVTSFYYGMRLVRIGKVVTLYQPATFTNNTVTAGQLNWVSSFALPVQFRPGGPVNTLLAGRNNGATTLLNACVDSSGNMTITVALSATAFTGNIGLIPFSITWVI